MSTVGSERKLRQFKKEPMRPGDPRIRAKGTLLIIGGAEDRKEEKLILKALAQRVGSGRLVVAPVASAIPDEMWEMYETIFRGLGVRHVHRLHIEQRADAESVRAMKVLEDATAVFFTGGDQTKITSMIGDTPVFSRVYEIFAEGGTIAGTSAGASVLSETMMVGGDGDQSHRIKSGLRLAPGFGFARDMVIDQHFAERGRIGRLLGTVAHNPRILGIGIDEDTAIELAPNVGFRVIGCGGVTVVNGASVTATNIAEEEADRTMSVFNITMHVLSQGDSFDIKTRTPKLGSARKVEEEIELRAHRNGNGNGNGKRHGNSNGNGNGKRHPR